MKTIYLHIGFHKTGTSILQETLTSNVDVLNAEDFDYPKPLCSFPSHQELAWCLFSTLPKWADKSYDKVEVYSNYVKRLNEANYGNFILSSEDLSSLSGDYDSIEFIRQSFREFVVKVVVYVRSPIEFILSLYHHALRAGKTSASFKEFLSSNVDFKSGDFCFRLEAWKDIFGKENLIVRKYIPYSSDGPRLIDDFCSGVGITNMVKIKDKNKRSNIGMHCWLYEVLSYVDASHQLSNEEKLNLRHKLFKFGLLLPSDVDAASHYLKPDDLNFIRQFYKDKIDAFAKEYNILLE